MTKKKLIRLIPSAVAFAMGVASVVLYTLGQTGEAIVPLLAIGVFCLGLLQLVAVEKDLK